MPRHPPDTATAFAPGRAVPHTTAAALLLGLGLWTEDWWILAAAVGLALVAAWIATEDA